VDVAFAQVREDALLDRWAVSQLPGRRRVFMIASGGCTAAALAGHVESLDLVDPNPAQLAHARRKLALLSRRPAERLAAIAEADQQGRYERLFAELRERLGNRECVEELCAQTEPRRQLALLETLDLGAAFEDVFALPRLVAAFGEAATANRRVGFAQHFVERTRDVLGRLPAATNPYLAQVMLGRYRDGVVPPWLEEPALSALPPVIEHCADAATVLERSARGAFDFVHLSNILDWLAPEAARRVLELADRALAPSGVLLVRQLNSTLDVRAMWRWNAEASDALLARDRSYFYRQLYFGQKTP
jgi:S-adenosylmethionine-diacylglycerol 3-amino-3-carboxypropyl transferase